MNLHRNFKYLFALGVVGWFCGGCASMMARPFPDTQNHLTVSVARHTLVWFKDIPVGSTRLKKNIFFSNFYNDKPGSSDFWLWNLIIQGPLNTVEIASRLPSSVRDSIPDLEEVTDQCVKGELGLPSAPGRFTWVEPSYEKIQLDKEKQKFLSEFEKNEDNVWIENYMLYVETIKPTDIQIVPYMVFSFTDREKARLWTLLDVYMVDQPEREKDFLSNPKRKPDWFCRYVVTDGKSRPMTGLKGWFEEDSTVLKDTCSQEVKIAADVMLEDINGKLRPDKPPVEKINGKWVFYFTPREVDARIFEKTENREVVLPLVGDSDYFAGVNILPKDFAEPHKSNP